MINDLEFENNKAIVNQSGRLATRIAALKKHARAAGIPAIYVNDNFGKWRSDFQKQADHCLNDGVGGQVLVERLRPQPGDYFVLIRAAGFTTTASD